MKKLQQKKNLKNLNKTKTSIMYEIRPTRFLPVFLMYTKKQRGLDMCATDSKKPPLFSQASLTKVQTIWAMIGKLSEVTPWWSKWGATRETSQVLTYGLYFPSSPREDSPPQLHCSAPCPYPLWAVTLCSPCLKFRASLRSSHSTQQQSQSRTQNHSSLQSQSELGERHP